MKSFYSFILLLFTLFTFGQDTSDKAQIEATLNSYIDGFYKGDTIALKKALKPRLYKFGYWKNKETGNYEYYAKMSYQKALDFAQKMKDDGNTRDENKIREIKVLDIGKHIASAKVTATWGIDYMTLSKDNGKWMIEQVIWEGPYNDDYKKETTTTYYLIRHADKDLSDKTDRNPHLTEKGYKRSKNWSKLLKNVKFDAVYSTDYNRTKETAAPTVKTQNLELKLYDPRDINIKQFMEDTQGKTVLIVGHSNTTPMFTNGLIGEKKYEMLNERNYGSIFIVTIINGEASSTVLQVD